MASILDPFKNAIPISHPQATMQDTANQPDDADSNVCLKVSAQYVIIA